jgi:hypothetical protein
VCHVPTAKQELAERHLIPRSEVDTERCGMAGGVPALQRVPSQCTAVGL